MTLAHDFDYVLQPHDENRRGEPRRAPRFSMEEVKRRRRNGQKTRSLSDIIDKAFVEHAETLRRLGE